ncbi:MAG: cytochrome b6-f complex iron-sulfur subunit [Gemmatales bacterium]|nr:MAG: cytochrome b6-f complex iron-sulfur subunit [Gemmatales bacterium]
MNEHDCPCTPADRSESETTDRRGLLKWSTILLGGLATAATGVPIIGFLLGPLRKQKDKWIRAGALKEFAEGEIRLVDLENPLAKATDGDTGRIAVYVRRVAGTQFQVFAVNCTHLGCPVHWFPQAGMFLCPCHGGAFYEDGSRASGPPPRALYEYEHRIENSELMVKLGHLPTLQQPA